MHILITTDTLGGVWTYTRELVMGLLERGLRVTLVSFGNIPSSGQLLWMERLPPECARELDFRPTGFKLEWMLEAQGELEASAEFLRNVIQETKPDLLHSNQFYYGALDCAVPRLVVAHSDVMSWWLAVHGEKPPDSPWMRWYRHSVASGLARATAVIAPSRWMLDQVEHLYFAPKRSGVISNGRSPHLFNPHISKEDRIVSVGRLWDQGKNTRLLLQRDMPAPVCLIGPDRHPDQPDSACVEGSPARQTEPQLDEAGLAQVLGRASIYAATSRYEPFGLAPLEAALSRCAVVASDIASFRELWDGAAVFFRNNDVDDLRNALELLVRDPNLCREYGNRAYGRARERFDAGRMVAEYVELYHVMAPVGSVAA